MEAKMDENERMVWAAAYVSALSWPGDGNSFHNAIQHAYMAVKTLRSETAHMDWSEPCVRTAREMLGDAAVDFNAEPRSR